MESDVGWVEDGLCCTWTFRLSKIFAGISSRFRICEMQIVMMPAAYGPLMVLQLIKKGSSQL